MSHIFKSFSSWSEVNTYLTATPGIVTDFEVVERATDLTLQQFKFQRIYACHIWHPPTNAVVHSTGMDQLGFNGRDQIGVATSRWWVAGADDDVTFDGELPAENTTINNTNKGNGRIMYFGGSPGAALAFKRCTIHIHGTVTLGGAEAITVNGLTPSGALVPLSTPYTNPGGVTAVNQVDTADLEDYVGIQFETSGIVAGTSFAADVYLINEK